MIPSVTSFTVVLTRGASNSRTTTLQLPLYAVAEDEAFLADEATTTTLNDDTLIRVLPDNGGAATENNQIETTAAANTQKQSNSLLETSVGATTTSPSSLSSTLSGSSSSGTSTILPAQHERTMVKEQTATTTTLEANAGGAAEDEPESEPVASADSSNADDDDDEKESTSLEASGDEGGNDDDDTDAVKRLARKRLLLAGNRKKVAALHAKGTTSVGARRVGSASVARSGLPKTAQLYTAIRRSANAAAAAAEKEAKEKKQNGPNDSTSSNNRMLSQSLIRSTVEGMTQKTAAMEPLRTMGVLGQAISRSSMGAASGPQVKPGEHELLQRPPPGTMLVQGSSTSSTAATTGSSSSSSTRQDADTTATAAGSSSTTRRQDTDTSTTSLSCTFPSTTRDDVSVRLATPKDDADICNLRLSVFSDFTKELRKQFCSRSKQVLNNRRLRGATCLVATIPSSSERKDGRNDVVLGSAELSVHEFHNTALGCARKQYSVVYVTEVAVNPLYRRCGIGSKLMEVCIYVKVK